MSKTNGLDAAEWARAPKPVGPLWERITKVFYDPEDNSILGRTPKRWGVVFTFYIVFYAVLGAMFAICMAGLHYSLNPTQPTWTLESSLIGANPGLALRPRDERLGPNIEYNNTDELSYSNYTIQIENFLSPYENRSLTRAYSSCVAADNYGYPSNPCFYVKLNKIFNWIPEYYDDVASLPNDMPADLKEHIKGLDVQQRKHIWISCHEDKNGIPIQYPWGQGMASGHYPYVNQKDYLSPLVAVQLQLPLNTDTRLHCRAWAKNIIYRKSVKEPSGYTWSDLKIQLTETPVTETTTVTTEGMS